MVYEAPEDADENIPDEEIEPEQEQINVPFCLKDHLEIEDLADPNKKL